MSNKYGHYLLGTLIMKIIIVTTLMVAFKVEKDSIVHTDLFLSVYYFSRPNVWEQKHRHTRMEELAYENMRKKTDTKFKCWNPSATRSPDSDIVYIISFLVHEIPIELYSSQKEFKLSLDIFLHLKRKVGQFHTYTSFWDITR